MLFEFARANSYRSAYTDEISQVKFANLDFRQYTSSFGALHLEIIFYIGYKYCRCPAPD
jgi:hypothetical protein